MEKLSIETLFPSEKYPKSVKPYNAKISVDTLYTNTLIEKEESLDFNSNILLKNDIERRKKIRKAYVSHYNSCCRNILAADDVGLKDIYYDLPDIITDCIGFKHDDCIKYISDNLRAQHLDTYPVNKYRLFVTWKYLELNKEDFNSKE